MSYRVGLPFWKLAARVGIPLQMVVCVHRDDEAGVYFAHSPDLRGLVVEADTLDALRDEVRSAATELLDAALDGHHRPPTTPQLRFNDDAICVA
jgi:predicted RNase H-like HicB family nuclease